MRKKRIKVSIVDGKVKINNSFGHIGAGGYVQFHPTKGVKMFAHRVMMEKHLKRNLRKEEFIHHINGIRNDNRIENLLVVSRTEHIKIHQPRHYCINHPNRQVQDIKSGLCGGCYSVQYAKDIRFGKRAIPTFAWCHQNRRAISAGMCTRCYQFWKYYNFESLAID